MTEIIVVIIIAVAVFVLGSLVRGKEEEREGKRGRADGGPTRRQTTDLDRFLEEARRRRLTADQRREMPPEPPPPPRPVERPRSRPSVEARPVQPRRRPAQPAQAPRPAKRTTARPVVAEVIPVAVAVELRQSDRAPARERLAAPISEAIPVQGAPDTTTPPIQASSAVVIRRQIVSPAVAQVAAMLRSPQTMRSAVVLQEILTLPLCKRQKHQ